jgi:hypothetical protein
MPILGAALGRATGEIYQSIRRLAVKLALIAVPTQSESAGCARSHAVGLQKMEDIERFPALQPELIARPALNRALACV